jgi:hypothetical protein
MRTIAVDKQFIKTIEQWLTDRSEILVLIRFAYAAGEKSFELFSSIKQLSERLSRLPARTSLIAFKEPQIPLRGIVDDAFTLSCLNTIPDGAEFLLVELQATCCRIKGVVPSYGWGNTFGFA